MSAPRHPGKTRASRSAGAAGARLMRFDAIVLGAGIVGVSVAAHLARRGRSVALVDRAAPGEETSYGNAGLVQREGIYPYAFPQDPRAVAGYALNRSVEAHYHLSALPRLAPFLARYWLNSRPARHERIARLYAPLIERSVIEHDELAAAAGTEGFYRRDGWISAFRSRGALHETEAESAGWARDFGIRYEVLDASALAEAEPNLTEGLTGAIRYLDPISTTDPGGLTKAYAEFAVAQGARLVSADARTLRSGADGWELLTRDGTLHARDAVVALGPWSDEVTKRLGYSLPLAVKRGYHMHYAPAGNAVLRNWVLDAEGGYFLAPMTRGIRLTTGAEFASRDAPPTPRQLDRAEPIARKFFPLGDRLDAQPWLGNRPCTPDMMPIIGPAPMHEHLWFAFGHAHHGLTLGPVTGRLIADLVTGTAPPISLKPYRADRF